MLVDTKTDHIPCYKKFPSLNGHKNNKNNLLTLHIQYFQELILFAFLLLIVYNICHEQKKSSLAFQYQWSIL